MNFSIDRDVLLENLNIVSKGLPTRTPMPVLKGIKLEIVNNDLYITASNTEISIQVIINDSSINVERAGGTVVPGKYLIDIIRKCNSKIISLSLLEEKILLISANKAEFKLRVMDILDYPNISFATLEKPLQLDSKLLTQIINETAFIASTSSEKKPIITGVNLKLENKELKCVSTDSFRLARKIANIDEDYDEFNITVPYRSLQELQKILENIDEKVSIYFEKNLVLFKYKHVLFQTRLLEGEYPDTSRLIDTEFPISIKFNRDELLESVSRISVIPSSEGKSDSALNFNIIKLTIDKSKKIIISSNTSVGDAKEELFPTSNDINTPLVIGFSAKYITDALRSFTSNEVTLNFTGEVRPFIILSDNDPSLTQLILPVRLA